MSHNPPDIKASEPCVFCGKDAGLLCDFTLGMETGGWSPSTGERATAAGRFEQYVPGKGLPYVAEDSRYFTCDAPMCDDCGKHAGNTFFDGQITAIESIDYCPLHFGKASRVVVLTEEEAERKRRELWKMRVVG